MSGPIAHFNRPRVNQQALRVSPITDNATMPTSALHNDMANLLTRVEMLEQERRKSAIRMDELENAVKLAAEADSKLVDSHVKEMEKTRILEERVTELEYLVASLHSPPQPATRRRRNASTSSYWGEQNPSYSGNKKSWTHPNERTQVRQSKSSNGKKNVPRKPKVYGRFRPDLNNYATGGSTFGPSEDISAISGDGPLTMGMDPTSRTRLPYSGGEDESRAPNNRSMAGPLGMPRRKLFVTSPRLAEGTRIDGVTVKQNNGYQFSSDELSNRDPEGSDESFDYVDSEHGLEGHITSRF